MGTASNDDGLAAPCPACPAGQFQAALGASTCSACAQGSCPVGSYESAPCSAEADRVCNPIPAIGGVTGCNVQAEDETHAVAPALTIAFGAQITSATVRVLAGTGTDDALAAVTFGDGVTVTSTAPSSLSLTGTAAPKAYEDVLRAVTFRHSGEMPSHQQVINDKGVRG